MSGNKNGGFYCLVRGCPNRTRDGKLSFFNLPKETERINQWLTICSREDLFGKSSVQLKGYRICAAHFEDKMYTNFFKKRLLPKAVPTIFCFVEKSQGDVEEVLPNYITDSDAGPSTSEATSESVCAPCPVISSRYPCII
ncbi:52 kDa repressor of the inhibitor of the protein kinase-like [Harmonia axyridis]|uniref:52 kDa repressor of the inhibitor of the protein kinase-like n=1 Tax=Harmonia axyridis TaxID=115357 RepID=UPI001E279404|nr:52 kDa repressor of the inhibitor of the protein kinase-like [Harmonia axyridis]